MVHILGFLSLLGSVLNAVPRNTVLSSEFQLDGDYLLGGLFDIHHVSSPLHLDRPEAIDCTSHSLILSSYQRFQLMRFAVEEINNSTSLLPNISLGYILFDQCSDGHSFPSILNLISVNGLIDPWGEPPKNLIGVIGSYTSSKTMSVAPLLMMDLIPMVSYGAASSELSQKKTYPSFLRTLPSNKNVIEIIVKILKYFKWHWVSFLHDNNSYGTDGRELFIRNIQDTEICLAYIKALDHQTDYPGILRQIDALRVHVIIVFASDWRVEVLFESAIQQNVTNKVWLATNTWSLNRKLPKTKGIRNIGTVLGVAAPATTIPGFSDFVHSAKAAALSENAEQETFCNQVFNCTGLSAADIIDADPSFSFPVYAAVHAIAHALHNTLQCGAGRCKDNITVYPNMVLAELKKINFTLFNQTIHFDENGDHNYGFYLIVFWNRNGDVQEVGYYEFYPPFHLVINSTDIQWHTNGKVPTSVCSQECPVGYKKKPEGIHRCCFNCEICPNETFINVTEDPYTCVSCTDAEWSAEGSTSCNLRVVEFVPFTDPGAVVIMVAALVLVGLNLAVSVLFAINFNTPVVRSAGGPLCFLILICLTLSSLSVYFYFGQPTSVSCVLRLLPFLLFHTVCLACFVVRSFQIVCIFKIAAKLPKLYSWWMKYHGQCLFIAVSFAIQALLLLIGYSSDPPKPFNETFWYRDKIVLGCDINLKASSTSVIFLLSLCLLCFIFSYMGKDLPKNYNEAKSITFCLLLFILTWIAFATVYLLYNGTNIQTLNALAVLSSLYSFLMWYFIPKCLIIIFQPQRNTQQYFQGLIQSYTKTISQ
ncbi:taste receptor type 1 member 1-like [Salarias fasciatus]|uniref:Taste receptor type 1 member 1-like n=1 Tax=Salarias fasciatus TaxID=181472 RepID=A0A672FYT5_SALFA|nr:taste receptor type 1 member 1-like [Salarias fasciatus]